MLDRAAAALGMAIDTYARVRAAAPAFSDGKAVDAWLEAQAAELEAQRADLEELAEQLDPPPLPRPVTLGVLNRRRRKGYGRIRKMDERTGEEL